VTWSSVFPAGGWDAACKGEEWRAGILLDFGSTGEFFSWAPKPIDEPEERRDEIIFSRPTKAPANTKSMLLVSIVYCSLLPACWSRLRSMRSEPRPPEASDLEERSDFVDTVTVVPSIIFKSPCWTPSPDTSRPCVITAGFASLSTSSKKIIPLSHLEMLCEEASSKRSMADSMSVPIYPACVRAEQSTVANGTSKTRARVERMYVFPTPEGPRRRRLDFSMIVLGSSSSGLEPSSGSGSGGRMEAFRSTVSMWPGYSSDVC